MRTFLLTCLIGSCVTQRNYRTNQIYNQGGSRYPETVPQSGARLDRYFNEPDWSEAGFDGWGMKADTPTDNQQDQVFRGDIGSNVERSLTRQELPTRNFAAESSVANRRFYSRPDGGRNQFAARPPVAASVATTENEGIADLPNRFTSAIEDTETIAFKRREGIRNRFSGASASLVDSESVVTEENGGRRNFGFGADSSGRQLYNREYQYQQRRRFESQPAVGGRRVEAELGGEEAGQYVRTKRPKRIRLAGGRPNFGAEQQSTDNQQSRWQNRETGSSADNSDSGWQTTDREEGVNRQQLMWQNRQQFVDREEYRIPVREETYRPAAPARNLIKVQDVTEGVAKVLDVNPDAGFDQDVPDTQGNGPFFQVSTPENIMTGTADSKLSEEHPGSLSFGLSSTPSESTSNDNSNKFVTEEVTAPTAASTTRGGANAWTTFGLEEDRDRLKQYLEVNLDQTPFVVDDTTSEDNNERIVDLRIKPKRWNADFERFKERSGMDRYAKPDQGQATPIRISSFNNYNKNVRQKFYKQNQNTQNQKENYRQPQNYRIRPRLQQSTPPDVIDRFENVFEDPETSIRRRFNTLDEINKDIFAAQPSSNRRLDSLKPYNPIEENVQETRRGPFRRPIIRQRPTESSDSIDDRIDIIEEVDREEGIQDIIRLDEFGAENDENEKPIDNVFVIEEKSKEGQGEYGPFFNINIPDDSSNNIPFTEVKDDNVDVVSENESVSPAPAMFLPTLAPLAPAKESVLQVEEKPILSSNRDVTKTSEYTPFIPSPAPFEPQVIPDVIERIDIVDDKQNPFEYIDTYDASEQAETDLKSIDFISGNPEFDTYDYETIKEVEQSSEADEFAEVENVDKESESKRFTSLEDYRRNSLQAQDESNIEKDIIEEPVIEIEKKFEYDEKTRKRITYPLKIDLSVPKEEILEPVATPVSTTELPTADSLQNLLAENEYSKTHIRLQKLRPREDKKPASESTVTQSSTSTTELQNIQEENRYSKTQISRMKIKKDQNIPRDYSNIQIKDIIKQIPVSKLNTLLRKSGYKVSDMFKKVPEVMDLVMKAVEDESFLESQLAEASMAFDPVKEDIDENDNDEQFESEETKEDTIRMPWAPRLSEESPNNNKRESVNNNQRKSFNSNDKSVNENNEVTEDSFESKLEDEVKTMDLKSLMKKISPMSLSEVLQKVGYGLPDIMSKNQAAIRAVLKYHHKLTKKEEEKVELSTKSSGWSPTRADYKSTTTTTTESTTVVSEETTKKSFRRKSSIDLFKKFRNRLTVDTPTTTTEAVNMVTPSTFKFGERTTKKRFTSIDDYRKSLESNGDESDDFAYVYENEDSTEMEKDIFDNPNTLKILDPEAKKELMEQDEELRKLFEPQEPTSSTTTTSEILNQTLANFNMTDAELDVLKERKDMAVPDLNNLFNDIERESKAPEIIYGAKPGNVDDNSSSIDDDDKEYDDSATDLDTEEDIVKQTVYNQPESESEKPKPKTKERPKYIQMDFGPGGYRGGYNNPFQNGWGNGFGSKSGGLITDRRTTTTTRATPPITYFDVNGDLVEDNIKLQSLAEESLLGDYEILDYDQYYDDYNYRGPGEVPESVRSALIASSVVGGLAVILFLAIFMLCLWKQMKSKLRMNGEFQEEKVGFFASMFGKKKIKDSVPNGYFNKVGSTTEPNYSTTSSDEY